MGRLSARVLLLNEEKLGLELVHVNEKTGGSDTAAYLLEFDSVHGRFPMTCTTEGKDGFRVSSHNGTSKVIKYTNEADPANIPWDHVDIVFECTGAFLTRDAINKHLARSVKKVIVSAPVDEEGVLNVVVGCNEHLINTEMSIVTAASCTTNCAAPIVGAIDAALGIEMGSINTVHDVTPTQSIMDVANPGKKNDLRRARSGATNLAPTTTGSAKAISMIYPHLKGKLGGLAVRVPCQNSSLTDLVLVVKRDTTAEEVNAILRAASVKNPAVLGYEDRPLVSTDYVNDPRSSIVDALSIQVIAKRLVKIFSWYDNEWGYVNRMVDLAVGLASKL